MTVNAQNRDFRVRIATYGATAVDGSVDLTLDAGSLADIPRLGSQVLRLLDGRTESLEAKIRVNDVGGALAGKMADPADAVRRLRLLGRLVDVQVRENGGAWATVDGAVGRLTNLANTDSPRVFDLSIQDERWKERNAEIWTSADTTHLYPSGLRYAFGPYTPPFSLRPGNVRYETRSGDHVRLRITSKFSLSDASREYITSDLKDGATYYVPGVGGGIGTVVDPKPFKTIKLRLDGTDYVISTFGQDLTKGEFFAGLDEASSGEKDHVKVWIYAPLVSWPGVSSSSVASVHAWGAKPTDGVPLHVGVKDTGHAWGALAGENGLRPFELVKRAYDLAGVRYDPVAMAILIADTRFPLVAYRATAVEKLSTWLETHIYGPLFVAPFIDAQGRVAPKRVTLPSADPASPEYLDTSTIFIFTASMLDRQQWPTWEHGVQELVNVYKATAAWLVPSLTFTPGALPEPGAQIPAFPTADHLDTQTDELAPIEAGNAGVFGERVHNADFTAFPLSLVGTVVVAPYQGKFPYPSARGDEGGRHPALAGEVLERYGDGPVYGRMTALRCDHLPANQRPATVQRGQFVLIDVDDFPNPAEGTSGGYGGQRLVQIIDRAIHPDGAIDFEYLDAGPWVAPLSAPTVTIAKSVAHPKHMVRLTVSGATGARHFVQIGTGTSVAWGREISLDAAGDWTQDIGSLPAGTKVWARGRSVLAGRITSTWSATVSVTLDAITAPSSLTKVEDGGSYVVLQWANGDTTYPMECLVDATSYRYVDAESTRIRIDGVSPGVAFTAAVRHFDAFGGASASASLSVTPGVSPSTCPDPAGIAVLLGA
jgi:hypothetical protein